MSKLFSVEDLQNQLSPLDSYLPKIRVEKKVALQSNPSGDMIKIQNSIQKVKGSLVALQKNQEQKKGKLQKKIEKIVQKERYFDEECTLIQQEQKGEKREEEIINKNKIESIQQIWIHQMRFASEIENQIAKRFLFLDELSMKVEKQHRSKSQTKEVKLPPADYLHNQAINEITKCQNQFNSLMEQARSKIDTQLNYLKRNQKEMIHEITNIIESRITFLSTSS